MRTICADIYKAHTEPLFNDCHSLKMNDISIFYYKLMRIELHVYFTYFMPMFANGFDKYNLRSSKFEIRSFKHEFIKLTCRYQLLTMLNNISNENNQWMLFEF